MDLDIFWKGLFAGMAVAAPVGPIGILCIQRSLAKGREYGLVSGLGAASADALYGFIAASGLIFIQSFMREHQNWFQSVSALFLLILGFRTFFSHPPPQERPIHGLGLLRAFTSSFFLALSPVTFLSITMVFVGFRVSQLDGNFLHSGLLVGGVFLGSASWWLILAGGMGWLRAKSDHNVLVWVNRIGGVILASFGILILIKMLSVSFAQ